MLCGYSVKLGFNHPPPAPSSPTPELHPSKPIFLEHDAKNHAVMLLIIIRGGAYY